MSPTRALVMATCLGLGGVLPAVEPDGPPVSEVRIEGAERLHPDRIRARLGTRVGEPLDRSTLAEDVRAIHEMRAFTGIKTRVENQLDGSVQVTFEVAELPYVGRVEITGVGYFLRRTLNRQLRSQRGNHLDPVTLERDEQRLLQTLKERNYLHAEVRTQTQVDSQSGIATVTFDIDPGYKVEVARVVFSGLPPGVVRQFLLPQLANQPGGEFDPEMLKWDAGAVAQYLMDQGYLDAQVHRVRDEFFDSVESWEPRRRHGPQLVPEGQKNDAVMITYFIDAGPRYSLGAVRFVHDPDIVSESELRSAFAMADGEPYRRREIEQAAEASRRVIANRGYARVRMDRDRVVDADEQTVELTLRFEEGRPYRIGRIDPDGNTVTRDQVIRRAMRLQPGELYSEDALDDSRRQILRAGIFRNEPPRPLSIDPVFDPERPDEVDLRVRVQEDDTGRFTFNLGFSSSQGVIGSASYQERNFDLMGAVVDRDHWRGAGHTLNANISWSSERTSFGVGFVNPSFLDGPYFLSTNFRRTEDTNLAWDEKRTEGSLTLGRNFFDRDLQLSIGYTYTDLQMDNIRLDIDNEAAIRVPGNFHMNTLTLRQTYDLRDNPSFPTSGFRVSLEQNFHGVLGFSASHPHMEFVLSGDAYLPLFEAELGGVTFLQWRQRAAYLTAPGDGHIPFYNRYFGGGPAPRHRGFESFDQGPQRTNILGFRARSGGTREVLTTFELNVPVQGTNRGFRAVLFTDIGDIWDEYDPGVDEDLLFSQRIREENFLLREVLGLNDDSAFRSSPTFKASDLKVAVGAGIRMPAFLPIALDFAQVLNPADGQSSSQFHFSISGGF